MKRLKDVITERLHINKKTCIRTPYQFTGDLGVKHINFKILLPFIFVDPLGRDEVTITKIKETKDKYNETVWEFYQIINKKEYLFVRLSLGGIKNILINQYNNKPSLGLNKSTPRIFTNSKGVDIDMNSPIQVKNLTIIDS